MCIYELFEMKITELNDTNMLIQTKYNEVVCIWTSTKSEHTYFTCF